MSYTPVNTDAYTNAYAGALAGMAVSGWIIDPNSADYANVAAIAGAFAKAFDTVWNNATALNLLQIQSIQSVCQEQFAGHAPGSLDNTTFAQAANWAVPAAACAALVLEGDAYVTSQGITPSSLAAGGIIRVDWAFWDGQTFNPGSTPPQEVAAFDSPGIYDNVQVGDTIFFPPIQCLLGFFHNAVAAPELGGVYVVTSVDTVNTTLNVSRDPRFSTQAQVNATALIVATSNQGSGSGGAGVYQVQTPKTAIFGTDPQVIEFVAIPAPPVGIGEIYNLQASGSKLFWTLAP